MKNIISKIANMSSTILASASVGIFFMFASMVVGLPENGLIGILSGLISFGIAISGTIPYGVLGAGISHYKNSKASMQNFEPLFLNLFELTLTPPTGIDPGVGNNGQNLLLEHVKKITGLEVDKNPGVVEQHYKFAKRRYAGAKPETTTIDFTVDFEVNLNEANSAYVFKTVRQWSDLIYNPNTGAMGLKKDYVGSGVLTMFNKNGDIYRKFRFPVIWPVSPINPIELDYLSTEIFSLSITFAADYWEDTFV